MSTLSAVVLKSVREVGAVSSSFALTTAVLFPGFLVNEVAMPESVWRIILLPAFVAFRSVRQFAYHRVFIAAVVTTKLAGEHSDFFSPWDRRSIAVALVTLGSSRSFKPGAAAARLALELPKPLLRHCIPNHLTPQYVRYIYTVC